MGTGSALVVCSECGYSGELGVRRLGLGRTCMHGVRSTEQCRTCRPRRTICYSCKQTGHEAARFKPKPVAAPDSMVVSAAGRSRRAPVGHDGRAVLRAVARRLRELQKRSATFAETGVSARPKDHQRCNATVRGGNRCTAWKNHGDAEFCRRHRQKNTGKKALPSPRRTVIEAVSYSQPVRLAGKRFQAIREAQ
jgi:hypothetical protein